MKPKTDVKYYRDPALPGIDICRVAKSNHHFPEHFHDDLYIITLIITGNCYCLGKDRQDEVSGPGCVTLLNPGQIHSGSPANDNLLDYAVCHLSLNAIAGLARDACSSPAPEFTATLLTDAKTTALMSHLFKTMITSRDSLEKEALMVAVSHFLLSRYSLERKQNRTHRLRHQPVIKAKEILSCALDRKLYLGEVAQSVGLSRYYFLRAFKRETGISPHLYRTLKRVEAARTLLSGGTPQAQVALETGFVDQSHFSNTFRRYVGATPKQYLAQK